MKKLLSMLLVLSMAAAMTGCEGGSTSGTAPETEAPAESTEAADESAAEDEAQDAETADTEDVAEVMSYDEYMAADLDSQVTIEAYVQAKQSWWENQATVYTQDEDGAYFLYNMACSEEDYELLTQGTKIRVTGYKTEWSGEVEIIDASFQIVEGDTFIAPALDVTEMLGTDDLINYQNQFVQFNGLTVEAAGQDEDGNDVAFLYSYDGSGSEGDDLYFNASYNGETYTFTIESYLCDSTTEVYSAVKALEIGQTVNMEGFLYWYEGVNPHITSVSIAE